MTEKMFNLKPFALFVLFFGLSSCSSAGKNKLIKEFYCNGPVKAPFKLSYVKSKTSELLSSADNIYDPLEVRYTKFTFEGEQFRVVGETSIGSVLVAFRKEECKTEADNPSPFVCTFTIGKIKRFGCGEVSFL
jgi:hypothetical protein